jgi:hypothetical protein
VASFTDDFNRADSTALGANWTEDSGQWLIASNALTQSTITGVYFKCRWVGTALDGNNNYAQVAGTANTSTVGYGAFVRGATSGTVTYYAAAVFPGDSDYLLEITAGAETILDTGSARGTGTLTVRVEADGTAITGLVDTVSSTSATDSSLTTGAAGVMCYGNINSAVAGSIDNFAGGDLAGGGPATPAFRMCLLGAGR